ncbi:hypothetical protein JCM3774_005966 [Rhodotorula dairenensis]
MVHAATPTPGRGTRTTAAAQRAAATASSVNSGANANANANASGRPRRAAGDASPYASTSTAPSPTESTAKHKATPKPKAAANKGNASKASLKNKPVTAERLGDHDEERNGKATGAAAVRDSSLQGAAGMGEPTIPPEVDLVPSGRPPATAGTAGEDTKASSDAASTSLSPAEQRGPSDPSNPTPTTGAAEPSSSAPAKLARLAAPTDSTDASTPSSSSSTAPESAVAGEGRRKSVRSTRAKGIDYSNLNQHLPASVDRWISTIDARTRSGQIVSGFESASPAGTDTGETTGWRRFADGHELEKMGDEWIYGAAPAADAVNAAQGGSGMMEPFVVERSDGLGMEMPAAGISVRVVADLVGPDTPLEVIDCASQSSLANWTLGQWADYYDDPRRDKVRNVISLEVSESKLGKMITAPKLVRQLDWVDTVWPEDMKIPGEYPRVQKYCLMSVERCWTDWHVDFAGSSVFYHVLRGGKTFFFIRPTPENLKAYEEWSGSSERQESTWLGDMCDRVYRMDLKEGNTAFIPTGWIHAVYTPADSLVIGGNFLHSLNIPTQLRVYEIELATKVPRKFRYPHFVKLLWLVARHYHHHLLLAAQTPLESRPAELRSARVLAGLKQLSSFLIKQTTRFAKGAQVSAERKRIARENVPWSKVADPVSLSREFRKGVLRALGEDLDPECFLPHEVAPAAEEEGAAKHHPTPNGSSGSKRKASDDAQGPKVKRTASSLTQPLAFVPYQVGSAATTDGEIIGRHTVPVVSVTRFEERIDPGSIATAPPPPNAPAVLAEVKESRSTQSVVRRWALDPTDPTGRGGAVVETRTVVTIVERVKFPHPSSPSAQQQQPYARYESTARSAYEQASGIGPPAPPSITAVPGSLASVSHPYRSQNAEPYQPLGWPYQYDLPSSSSSFPPLPSSATIVPQNSLAHGQQPRHDTHQQPQQSRIAQPYGYNQQQQYAPGHQPMTAAAAVKPDPRRFGVENGKDHHPSLSLPPLPSMTNKNGLANSNLPPLPSSVKPSSASLSAYSTGMPPPPAPRRMSGQASSSQMPPPMQHQQQQSGSVLPAYGSRTAQPSFGYTMGGSSGPPHPLPLLPEHPQQQQQPRQNASNGHSGGAGGDGRVNL